MLLLDTPVLVRWIGEPDSLSAPARDAIRAALEAGETLYVSSISVWEIALLVAKERLRLAIEVGEWIARAEAIPFLTFLPVDNQIALRSVDAAATAPRRSRRPHHGGDRRDPRAPAGDRRPPAAGVPGNRDRLVIHG